MKSLKQLKRSWRATAVAAAVCSAAPLGVAFAESEPKLVEASIPFANYGGIRDWHPDRDRGLWVQSLHKQWYYARFMGNCLGLNFATTLGFDTHPMGSFDRWSSVIVPRYGRCTVQSLSLSDGPPKRPRKGKNKDKDKDNAAPAAGEGAAAPAAEPPVAPGAASKEASAAQLGAVGATGNGGDEVVIRDASAGELVAADLAGSDLESVDTTGEPSPPAK